MSIANNENLKKGKATQFKSGENAVKNALKANEKRRQKKGIREAMQALLSGTYNLKDKDTGEVRTMTGEEAIALSIMQEAMNKKSKNWAKAVQYALQLTGEDRSKVENDLIKAQAEMLKAKADILTGADTTTLDKLDDILKEMKENAYIKSETE